MSVKSEESDKKFREWKEDIQKRCEERLRKNPEFKPIIPKLGHVQTPSKILSVQVLQSEADKGVWLVWKDGILMETFEGPLAHAAATKYANEVINGSIRDALRIPDPCPDCGNRYSHRTGCPNRREML